MKILTINPHQPNPFRLDYLAESIMEGLQEYKDVITIISSAPCTNSGNVVNDGEFIEHAKDADYIFVIWDKVRLDKPEPKYYLLDNINRPEITLFIDGAEWTRTGHLNPKPGQFDEALTNPARRRGEPWIWEELNDKVKWHFKRECYPQDREKFGCIPLPFASIKRYFRLLPPKQYTIQCSFGQLGTGLRNKVQAICEDLSIVKNLSNSIHINDMVIGQFPHETYLELMSKSIAVVDAWGGGDCNAHFYEAVASGACLIYQKYQILTPYPYIDGQSAITYTTPEEFREKVLYYFHKNKRIDEVKRIAKRSFNNTLNHHTSEKRVKYIFDVIINNLNIDEVIG